MGGNKKTAAGVTQVDENKSPGSAANSASKARGSDHSGEKEVCGAIGKFKLGKSRSKRNTSQFIAFRIQIR